MSVRFLLSSIFLCLALATSAAAQDVSARLTQLHDDLRLTADQEDAWRQYASVAARGVDAQSRHQAAQALLPQLPTPRRLALLDATMTQDLADFHRQSQAVMILYEHLTPDQQRTFDRETQPSDDNGQGSRGGDVAPGRTLHVPPPSP
jgi:hypothetical protein